MSDRVWEPAVLAAMQHLAAQATRRALQSTPSFTWVAIGDVVHAFTGRRSLCLSARLPKNWLQLGRQGAVCFACSKALRDRKTVKALFAPTLRGPY